MENKLILFSVFVLIFIFIPISSYSDIPSIKASVENDYYNFGQPIKLEILVQNGVQHNSMSLQVFDPDGKIIHSYSWGNQLAPITEINTNIISSSKWTKEGQYTIKVTYHADSNSYSDSISFGYKLADTEIQNYFPNRDDIGTEWTIKEIKTQNSNVQGFRYSLCQEFQPYDIISGFMRICIYNFESNGISSIFEEWKSNSLQEGGFKTLDTHSINADNCIGKLFPAESELEEPESRIMCQINNYYFQIDALHIPTFEKHWHNSESDILKFAEIVSEKVVNSNVNEQSMDSTQSDLASFVDSNKDPQYYLERYYNEPEYRTWFDRNYPDYTIEEAIGLEPKSKIPEWIKSIFAFYLDEKINDEELVKALQFLIKEGIIEV